MNSPRHVPTLIKVSVTVTVETEKTLWTRKPCGSWSAAPSNGDRPFPFCTYGANHHVSELLNSIVLEKSS